MEFIQCPHCQKQYAVSDKLRAASGKKIRCKHCNQAFEIIVQSRSESKAPEPEEISPAEQQSAEAVATGPKQIIPEQSDRSEPEPVSRDASLESNPAKPVGEDLFDLSSYNSESYFDSSEVALNQESAKEVELPKTTEQATSERITIDAPEENAETDSKKEAVKTKPLKKALNVQLLFTIVLATTLLIAAIAAAYLFLAQPELLSTAPKEEAQKSIVIDELFKPLDINIANPKPEPVIKEEPLPTITTKLAETLPRAAMAPATIVKAEQVPAKIFNPSQVCKDVSAEYWVRSHTLATTNLDTTTYMKLLDQNLVQADEIRRACKDKTLVGSISKAARANKKLDWIIPEINKVQDKSEAAKKRLAKE